jgi:hypothetical protein
MKRLPQSALGRQAFSAPYVTPPVAVPTTGPPIESVPVTVVVNFPHFTNASKASAMA